MLSLNAGHIEEFVQQTVLIEHRGYHRFTGLDASLDTVRDLWHFNVACQPELSQPVLAAASASSFGPMETQQHTSSPILQGVQMSP